MFDSVEIENYLSSNSEFASRGWTHFRVSNFKRMTGGITNQLYAFCCSYSDKKGLDKRVGLILKIYPQDVSLFGVNPDKVKARYITEFEALRQLDTAGFPVPSVYVCETDPSFLGHPFIIMQNEQAIDQRVTIDCFAAIMVRLHNLPLEQLAITTLVAPKGGSSFAVEKVGQLKQSLRDSDHNTRLKRDFDYAINWLDRHALSIECPKYSLIHGEFHPDHTIITNEGLKVIDWESVEIGDPAFDVGYACNIIELMYRDGSASAGQRAVDEFLANYTKDSNIPVIERVEFYKVVGILQIAIDVGKWMSNPLVMYKRFGPKAMSRAIAFQYIPNRLVSKTWLNSDFLISCVQYFQDLIASIKQKERKLF